MTSAGESRPYLSVVVPVFDEEESVALLHQRVREAGRSLGRAHEIVFVDDGSQDRTFEILRELAREHDEVKALRLRRNYGQTAAMAAGFEVARGAVVVSMDGDLQNDPADIPRLVATLEQGYDVVCGWRKERQDKLISRRIPSLVANWIIGKVTGVSIHDNGCSLKAYRASVIKSTSLYSELHRFIPAMSTLTGARIAEIVVQHHARRFGRSKYGLGRIWRVFLDIIVVKMITSFSSRHALWFGLLGLPIVALGAGLLMLRLAPGWTIEEGLLLSTLAFLLFFLGAHVLSMGILAELAMRTGDFRPGRTLQPTLRMLEVECDRDENGGRNANGR